MRAKTFSKFTELREAGSSLTRRTTLNGPRCAKNTL
jgi:hypothetical protein